MNTALRIASVGLLMLAGCAPTTMYTSGGYLTAHGVEQTSAEREKIMATCNSQFERTEPEFFDCMRDLIPLAVRFGDEYAEIMSDTIYAGRNVVLGYQAGNISQQSTIEALDEIGREFALQEKIWGEQYTRIVSARNAREKELARQRMGTALSNAGSDLLTQSYADGSKSISCTEIVSGTITCSQW